MDTEGLFMICAGLGLGVDDDSGGVAAYTASEYCLDNLKDLQRFLRRDDPQRRDVFKLVCKWHVASRDLIPIIEHYQSDSNLVINAVKILVFLTMPIDNESEDVAQQMEHLWDLKAVLTRNVTIAIIVALLEQPLEHLERDAFTEDDWKLVQLVLTLFRNLLAIKGILPQQKAAGSAVQYLELRDRFLEIMFQENVTDLILVLTEHLNGSCSYLREDNLLLLEIYHHIFVGQDPELIAKTLKKGSTDDGKVAASLDSLKSIMELEQEKRRMIMQTTLKRHSQFSGTFTRLSMDGSKTLFKGNPAIACGDGLLKVQKVQRGPMKRIAWDHGSTTSPKEILELLFNFLNQFLSGAYNVLMQSLRHDIQKEHEAIQRSDIVVFFQVADFVIAFQYQKISVSKKLNMECDTTEASLDHKVDNSTYHGDFCGPIAATMNEAMFQLVISKWREAFEKLKELKDHSFLSAAVSLMKNMIRMLDLVLKLLPEDSKEPQTTRILLYKLFYDQTDQGLTQFLLNLFKSFDTHKQPKSDLADLLEIIHIVFRLMEKLQARGILRVAKKSRKIRKKKISKDDKPEAERPTGEHTNPQNGDDCTHKTPMPERIVEKSDKEPLNEASSAEKGNSADKAGTPTSNPSIKPTESAGHLIDDSPHANSDKPNGDFSSAMDPGISPQDTEQPRDDSSHMDSDSASSDNDMPPPTNEVDFNVSNLVTSFANNAVVQNLCWLLKYYKSNSATINHYIIRMLQRFCEDLELSPMLYQLSVLVIFYEILAVEKSSEYANIVHFLTKFIRKMLKMMKKQPMLFVEILFWKTRKECHYINAEALKGDLVKMKNDIKDLDGERVNTSKDEEQPGRKSLADALGDDEADFVFPHDPSYERQDSYKENETLSDGDHQNSLRNAKSTAVKKYSAALFINDENDDDRSICFSDGSSSDSHAPKVSKRRKGLVFDQEQESAIKDLYEKYKDDRRCSHLIAEALDPDGKISPLQVYAKLRKLGLKVASRKKLASADLDGEAGDDFNSGSTPHSSNNPEDDLLLKTSLQKRRSGTFSKELEAKVIALFERFKTDKKCSQLIASALDADNTYSAAQVYRKLRQLGLLVPRTRLTKASKNLKEEEVIKTTENSDEETLVAIKDRSKGKKSKPSIKEAATKTISQHGGTLEGEHDNDNEPLSTILKSKGKKSKPSNKEATETISPCGGTPEGEHDPDNEPLSTILKKVKKRKSPMKEAVMEITSQHEETPEGEHDKPLSTILKNKVKRRKSATKESVTEIISQHSGLQEDHVPDNEPLSTILKSKVKKRKSSTKEVAMETTFQPRGMAVDEHAPDNKVLSDIPENEKVDKFSKDEGEMKSIALDEDFEAEMEAGSRDDMHADISINQNVSSEQRKYDEPEDLIDSGDEGGPALASNKGAKRVLKMIIDDEDYD